jgi:hypothetical protein
MIKYGFSKCGSCHTDPSGGETLTQMGRVESDRLLSFGADPNGYPRERGKFLFGAVEEPDWLRLGGSARGMGIYKFSREGQDSDFRYFPMQADAYGTAYLGPVVLGGSLGYARVKGGSPHARAAQVTTGQGYDPNLISRSHYVGLDLGHGYLLRLGRLNLPFGVRIPEHVMWVRDATRTDRESDQQHGIAFSANRGKWRSEVMGIAGNYQVNPDEFRERGYSAFVEYLLSPTLAVGASSLWTTAERDRLTLSEKGYVRNAHGLTARVGFAEKVAILAEADMLKATGSGIGYVGMVQGDYEPLQGLHAIATLEAVDQGKSKAEDVDSSYGAGKPRLGAWLSAAYFFYTHFDARVDLVSRRDDPLTLNAQIHVYF